MPYPTRNEKIIPILKRHRIDAVIEFVDDVALEFIAR